MYCSPATFTVPVENWYSTRSGNTSTPTTFGAQAEFCNYFFFIFFQIFLFVTYCFFSFFFFLKAIRAGLADALENTEGILPNTEIILDFYDNQFSTAVGISFLIDFSQSGVSFVPGNPLSDVVAVTGQAATVYGVAQLSGTANTAVLSDKSLYPFFSRSYVPSQLLAGSTVDTILSFFERQGLGWDEIALLSTTEGYGIALAAAFLDFVDDEPDLQVITYQQFLNDAIDVSVEVGEIERSGARVIVAYLFAGVQTVIREADERGIIGEGYVWFTGPTIAGFASTYTNPDTGEVDEYIVEKLQGFLGSLVYLAREGERYERYLAEWQAADPTEVSGSGPGTTPPLFPTLTYDVGFLIGLVVDAADKEGILDSPISAQKWTDIIRAQEFTGATGDISFDEVGDRPMPVAIANWNKTTLTWDTVAIWELDKGTEFNGVPIIWPDGTTTTPDLDIRDSFDYWSCDKKEERTDETGKTITLHTPDGGDFDDIDIVYHCDQFIDCKNLSDESVDCASNYLALFIAFGIITGILILITCCFIPFVIVFGCIIPRKRVRASSPIFLLVIVFSGILGYASTFAWYGKPHPVACGFQPWLLGLAVVSLISALCAKTWRIWRIFNKRFSRTVISDKQLVLFYCIMMAPAILILIIWTIVSTPTADMENRSDEDHYVCTTGGFTGKPGGLVFFFILVGYEALVLLFGAFLSVVTRKVPMFFNESKLIAISIYNLGFLAVVVIPVFLVLQEFNPFAAWIIRTCAILYAFTATLWLQFIPKIIGVIIIDKGQDSNVNPKSLRTGSTMQSQSATTN